MVSSLVPLTNTAFSVTPGVRVHQLANKVGYFVGSKVATHVANRAINKAVTILNDLSDKYLFSSVAGNNGSGSNSTSPVSNNSSKSSNGSNNSDKPPQGPGKPKNPKGGRRPKSTGNVGGSLDVDVSPRTSLDTGIDSGTIINPLQEPTGDYTPLFIQCGQLFPSLEQNKDSTFTKLMNIDLYYKYLILVQSEINYSLARQFTQEKLLDYIIKISYALQLYYMIDSILAYTSYSPNNNIGMTRLRMAITPEIANGHVSLKQFLETTPIPPNLLMFIRYMYQNFSFSEVIGAPVVRLSFFDVLCTREYNGLGMDGSTYADLVTDLIGLSETISTIKKIRPSWVVKMPPSFVEATYDAQFITFWHNCNVAYEEFDFETVKYSRSAKTVNDSLYYGIFGDRLDGLIYASSSILLDNNTMELGLWKPFDIFKEKKSINSSILSYSKDGSIGPINERSIRISSMVYSAPYSYVTKDGNYVWELVNCSYAAVQIPQTHTLENVTQAMSRSMIWLLNP